MPLAELHPGDGPADVEIVHQQIDRDTYDPDLPWIEGGGSDVTMHMEGMVFRITDGRRIEVGAPAATGSADIRLWLLGTVMAALLHQRNYLPVHANMVALPGGGTAAFAGDSGAGKSTLAAHFEQRGYRVLADDLCAIRLDGAGKPVVFEGIPRLKLWADALDVFGRSRANLEQVAAGFDKYHVPLTHSSRPGSLEPLPLNRMYILDRAAEGEPFAIVALNGAEAADAVLSNAFRWELGQMIQTPRAQFDRSLALARHTSVFRVRRRWGFETFEADSQAIERHMREALTPRSA